MPGYLTRQHTVQLGGHDYRIRALRDLQQFADPDGHAEQAGISSALWSLFGHIWPSGRVLAEEMCVFDIAGKRILELGCGLGLSSLVLQRRLADVVASDHHPLAESFLAYNAALNGLPQIAYRHLPWAEADGALGHFDMIIGSDLLYERGHAELLSGMMQRHARRECEVLIADIGRGNANSLSKALASQGYSIDERRCRFEETDTAPFRGRLLSYRR
ncbi:protein N-lysine methyltransferase family protein [Luteimonas sp. SX5]|uniref:Protein N-lysine methyltransferase family protein n=1 Tax=Luteimonas galliterrae TaxID=2940486 RepID=A0ABT0MHA0_9GAMM|nr:protein N-lysine methyltransferase family protein [Luteimonas galliterrae]MCL1634259.1 protein N-lysine methyltransferase family protein [Luteimonas galliterrae]